MVYLQLIIYHLDNSVEMSLRLVSFLVFLLFLFFLQPYLEKNNYKALNFMYQKDVKKVHNNLNKRCVHPKMFCNIFLLNVTYYLVLVTLAYVDKHVGI